MSQNEFLEEVITVNMKPVKYGAKRLFKDKMFHSVIFYSHATLLPHLF